MNIILAMIAVGCLVVIMSIVVYDFVQKQQAISKLDSILNPPPKPVWKQTWTYDECIRAYTGEDKEQFCGRYK